MDAPPPIRELEGGGEPQPEPEPQTLRDRLRGARGGSRVERYERVFADRRRERFRDPQVLEDDVYRAKQRVASAMVFNHYLGINSAPPRLTGEGHNNPTVEASGGFMGTTFGGPLHQAPRPIARSPYSGRFGLVDTGKEIRDSTRK